MAKKQTPTPPPRPPTPQPESSSSKEEDEEEYEEYEEIEVEEEVEVEEDEDEEEVEQVENQEEAEVEVENREHGGRKEKEKDKEEAVTRDAIRELLQPFGKDQLISLLKEAARADPALSARLAASADSDPAHRKIFVHGLPWDATSDALVAAFRQYGDIEECNAVVDKVTGKAKGYGFVLFRTRAAAQNALREPQKKIGSRVASCQLASAGPVQGGSGSHNVKSSVGTTGAAQSAPLGVGAGAGAAVWQPNDLSLAYSTASLMGINPAAAGLVGQNVFPGAIGLVGQNPALPTQAYESALGFGGTVSGINTANPSVFGGYGLQAALQGLGALHGGQLPPGPGMQSQAGLGSLGGNMPQYLGR